jgi:hypothetical protein
MSNFECLFKPRVGALASDFYFVVGKHNRQHYWSRITKKPIAVDNIPDYARLLPDIKEKSQQDVLLDAYFKTKPIKKSIAKLREDIAKFETLVMPNAVVTPIPDLFFIYNEKSKKFFYNSKFEIVTSADVRKLGVDPTSVPQASDFVANQFYLKRLAPLRSKLEKQLRELAKYPVISNESLKALRIYDTKLKQRSIDYAKECDLAQQQIIKDAFQRQENNKRVFAAAFPQSKLLEDRKIYSHKDLQRWLTRGGHPDKGGDLAVCQAVMEAARVAFG